MARPAKVKTEMPKRRLPPATTPEGRENQIISLAYDLIERRLLEGTASSAETTAIIRLGTERARLEKAKLEQEVKLAAAKTEAIESNKKIEEAMENAINAIRSYQGQEEEYDEEEIF